ncbi:MAG: hypothetical protein WBL93_08060 [Lutisporaceae bacterium]
MKKRLLMVVSLVLVLTMVFSFSGIAYAISNDNPNQCKNLQAIKNGIKVKNEVIENGQNVTVVTDSKELENLKNEFGIVAPNGKKLQRIEICEPITAPNTNGTSFNNPASPIQTLVWDYYIKSITDRGTGWYFPNDPYMDNFWDGPDVATISQTQSIDATANASVGVTVSEISASVGFSVTSSYSVTLTSTTTVPAGSTLEVKTYITYKRVDYDVWADNIGSDDTYYATGSAYKPLGSYFMKIWYY